LHNDDTEDCIKRETEEETGCQISLVKKVFEAYISPGSVTRILYFYVAEYTDRQKVHAGGGMEGEQEDIELLEININTALRMIETGEVKDRKTIVLLQYIRLHQILKTLCPLNSQNGGNYR